GTDTLQIAMQTGEKGTIGAYRESYNYFYDTERKDYTIGEALPAGVTKGVNFLTSQIKAFGKMFSGKMKVTESLGGFGTFTKLFPDSWGDWERFWNVTALISLILAFMNLLPIPALDGGHVMFLIYEIVTGRKPTDKFMEYATIAGFVFVLGLVLLANGLDVYRAYFQ
ncbi:MAG: site-2 protease family protein, partial [Bacteroidia bacterium]|nr:site-2 protease family protein [Bacteroidia bacterium]